MFNFKGEVLVKDQEEQRLRDRLPYNWGGQEPANRTHLLSYKELREATETLKNSVKTRGDLPDLTVEEQCTIIDDLCSSPLGRHICLAGGSDGRWTDYITSPQLYLPHDFSSLPPSISECFILFHSPVVLAQRELVKSVQRIAQEQLADGKVFASIPCGMMRDLLSLDFSCVKDQVSLVGIDIDTCSIEEAKRLATALGVGNVNFFQKDAWHLGYKSEFDFISSVGLNVYESDKNKVIELYRQFHKALKTNGMLVTGVLTWPPYIDATKSDWVLDMIPPYTLYLERVIHKDILDIKWLNFRTLNEIKEDFKEAGFSRVEIYPDSRCVFPAVVAIK